MPITTNPYAPITFVGDGVTSVFTCNFPFQLPTDITVTRTVTATNVSAPLVLGTDYSVLPVQSPYQNSPASTGSVTLLLGPLAVGNSLTIGRATPLTQLTTWVPNDPNPSTATMNAVDKLTLIAQETEAQIQALQVATTGGIVTTAVFAIAAVNASQTVTVNTVAGLSVGNNVQISNVINTMYGQITAINTTTLVLTITTLAITSGLAGNNMPVHSPVQLASIPQVTTITAQDLAIAPSPISGLTFTTSRAVATASLNNVELYINTLTSGNATIYGIVDTLLYSSIIPSATHQGTFPALLGFVALDTQASKFQPTGANQVLISTSSSFNFGLIGANNVTSGSLTPVLLNATNSPADTQVPSYDSASGHFKWINPGASGLPGGGTTGQFLRGDVTWSNVLVVTSALTPFVINTPSNLVGMQITGSSSAVVNISNGNGSGLLVSFDSNQGTNDTSKSLIVNGAVKSNNMTTLIDPAPTYPANPVEGAAFFGIVRAAGGFRSLYGSLTKINAVNVTSPTLTVDLATSAYWQLQGFTTSVTITLADSTPLPSSQTFAGILTLEIDSPSTFTITWPGNITWANGASAPNLSQSGINIVRLVRRQGQTQWIGYVENSTFALTPGSINNTNLFTASSVPISAINATGTASSTTFLRGDGSWQVPTSVIAVQQNSGALSTVSTLNFNTNMTLSVSGNVATIGSSGGSGGGTAFSPAISYTWTATQTFSNALLVSNYTQPSVSISTSLNALNTGNGVQTGLFVNGTGPDGSYSTIGSNYILNSSPSGGINCIETYLDCRANLNSANFWIGHTGISQARKLTAVNATVDAVWLNAWSPMHQYSSSADPQGIIHQWTNGFMRIGELNYGNAWADFGLVEKRGIAGQLVVGLEFFPDHLPGSINVPTTAKYNANWAVAIGAAAAGTDNYNPQNWIGLLIAENGIAPGGYGLRLWGSNGTFNTRIGGIGASAATNAPNALIKISGTAKTGIDFAGTLGDSTPLTATATGAPAIILPEQVSIQFGTGLWLRGNSGALQYSTNGSSWTNVTLP